MQTTLPTEEAVELVREYLSLAEAVRASTLEKYDVAVTEIATRKAQADWFGRSVAYWRKRLTTNSNDPFFSSRVMIDIGYFDADRNVTHLNYLLNTVLMAERSGIREVTFSSSDMKIMGKIKVKSEFVKLDEINSITK